MSKINGPWSWYWRQEDGEANCGVYFEERPGMAYSICRAPRYVDEAEWQEHARLIAAAPDLLEALQSIIEDMDSDFGTDYDYNKARAAIAKALGETS